ncbi:MAG TPA: DUF3291 domain-containing protein [Solirubrobacteraceae bacterium]
MAARHELAQVNIALAREPLDDPQLIINLTVWESLEAMRDFVYGDRAHLAVMRRRREWFERVAVHTALWWVPAGHRPTVIEAEERLEHLREHGPTPTAFTFRHNFRGPEAVVPSFDDRSLCPA